jgi:hypothetical protein
VWFNFRGNSSVLLSESKALSTAAHIRGDLAADDLAQKQAQWLMGRNPFSASIMYGEGYDWTPLYSVRSGQMVGALPVGIETKGNADAPYWPTQICWTYKEVWTQPVGEWIWLMQDLNGPAVVRGIGDAASRQPVTFRNPRTGFTKTAHPDPHSGAFRLLLPQGKYTAQQGAARTTLIAISGGTYDIDLRRGKAVDYTVTVKTEASGEILLRVTARGAGRHTFSIRAENLEIKEDPQQTLDLASANTRDAVWHAHVSTAETPWVAVVIADNTLDNRREVTGIALSKAVSGN